MARYTSDDIERRYQDLTACARIKIRSKSPFVGGQPATRDGLEAYVMHHLGLKKILLDEDEKPVLKRGKEVWTLTDEGKRAVARILKEEIGDKDITPDEGEIDEKQTYAVNVLRWTEHGPWIGDWMVKACMKQAISRLGLFQKAKGSKGDVAEVGRAVAIGDSLKSTEFPQYIHLMLPDNQDWSEHLMKRCVEWDRIFGRVHTPQGAKSIVTDCEVAPPGTWAEFEWRWYPGRLTEDMIVDAFAIAGNCGLGSARSLERGKFEVMEAEILDKKPKYSAAKKAKPAKKDAKKEAEKKEEPAAAGA